jgi:nucleoid DNA-binding protein
MLKKINSANYALFFMRKKKMTFSLAEMEKYLTRRCSEKTNINFPIWICKDIPRIFCEGIREHVLRGEKIRLECVGVLEICDKKPRVGRNPKTGEVIKIPAKKGITFRISDELSREMNGEKREKSKRVKKLKTA